MVNGSVSDQQGIAVEDEVLAVNGQAISQTINDCLAADMLEVTLTIKRRFETKDIILKAGSYYPLRQLLQEEEVDTE